jgi:hypothetical protein
MGRVLFRCPKTQEEFDSGFQAGATDMVAVPQTAAIRLRCTICGTIHEFKIAQARVEERPSARSQ